MARGLNENTASSAQVRHSDVNPNSSTGKLVAETTKNPNGTLSHHNLTISWNDVGHVEKVYSNVRHKLGRPPGEDMLESGGTSWTILSNCYVPPRTRTSRRSNSFSIRYFAEVDPGPKSVKNMECPQLIGMQSHG